MKVKIDAVRALGAKVKADLDAEFDRIEAAGETELTPLALELLAELAALGALVQATGPQASAEPNPKSDEIRKQVREPGGETDT